MKKLFVIMSVLLLAMTGCRKVDKLEPNLVVISEESVTEGIDNAIITALYSYDYELKSVVFLYSKDENLNNPETKEVELSDGKMRVLLENLKPKTRYYYQFKFYSGYNCQTTYIHGFKTLFKDALPTVVTGDVTDVTSSSASCSGEVVSDGNLPVTKRGLCWCFHPAPSIDEGSFSIEGDGVGTFVSEMTDLRPNTTYYVRAYATNSKGTAYGEDRMFTTENR